MTGSTGDRASERQSCPLQGIEVMPVDDRGANGKFFTECEGSEVVTYLLAPLNEACYGIRQFIISVDGRVKCIFRVSDSTWEYGSP